MITLTFSEIVLAKTPHDGPLLSFFLETFFKYSFSLIISFENILSHLINLADKGLIVFLNL